MFLGIAQDTAKAAHREQQRFRETGVSGDLADRRTCPLWLRQVLRLIDEEDRAPSDGHIPRVTEGVLDEPPSMRQVVLA